MSIPEAPPVLRGERVQRVHWVLGTDQLRAVCHCGAERLFDDPIELWEWLLGHPEDHRPVEPSEPSESTEPTAPPPRTAQEPAFASAR